MFLSFGGISLTTFPPISILPLVISSRPAIILKIVLFPQPDGPTKTKNSFSAISRSTPLTASVLSNVLCKLVKDTSAIIFIPS